MSSIITATGDFFDSFNYYLKGLRVASKENFDAAKMIIFTGGADINPSIYGESNRHAYYNETRDRRELYLLARAVKEKKKIFGVCRGLQLIVAYFGSKLVQDLQEEIGKPHSAIHEINYVREHEIKQYFPTRVNSLHHQGVLTSDSKLPVVAEHNGIAEIVANENILAVQFHPEFLAGQHAFFDYIRALAEE